ncbi:MAG: ATP-binding protein [Actinomycetota bacterium]
MKHKIFEPFRQGAKVAGQRSGTGLGLSLVEKFAGLHAGSAWVEDRPDGGSIFRVHLPGEVRRLAS